MMRVCITYCQIPVTPDLLAKVRTIAGLAIIGIPLILSIRPFRPIKRFAGSLIPDTVTYNSLVPPTPPTAAERATAKRNGIRVWRQLIFVGLGLAEVVFWTFIFGSHLIYPADGGSRVWQSLLDGGMVLVWVRDAARTSRSLLKTVMARAQTCH